MSAFSDLCKYGWHDPDKPCASYFDDLPGKREMKLWKKYAVKKCSCGFYQAIGRALAAQK